MLMCIIFFWYVMNKMILDLSENRMSLKLGVSSVVVGYITTLY